MPASVGAERRRAQWLIGMMDGSSTPSTSAQSRDAAARPAAEASSARSVTMPRLVSRPASRASSSLGRRPIAQHDRRRPGLAAPRVVVHHPGRRRCARPRRPARPGDQLDPLADERVAQSFALASRGSVAPIGVVGRPRSP
ncbi:MAG: hypothetical protein U5K43_00365 [Halofilum sp. (in: g-proteobacteria)]|nr:hypothetical protein [Halofilum sp. (in: g-proteobacteria)]